jgi:hypothetical protein
VVSKIVLRKQRSVSIMMGKEGGERLRERKVWGKPKGA